MSAAKIDRLQVTRGPALVTLGTAKFLTKDDIVVSFKKSTKAIPSSAYGDLGKMVLGVTASTKFTPVGQIENLDVLYPFASMLPGASIFGDQDTTLLIQPLDTTQKAVQFHAAGISKSPSLNFTATDTLFGDLEIQMIGANNVAVDDPSRLFSFITNTLTDTGYDKSLIRTGRASLRWLSGGTFEVTFGANTTAALAYNITAADLETALNALASVTSAGGVTVTGSFTDGWLVTFDSVGARAAFTGTAITGMPGGTALSSKKVVTGTVSVAEQQLLQLTPWSAFPTREGVKVDFNITTFDDQSDGIGRYDTIFQTLEVTATGIPQIDQESAVNAALIQGANAVPGSLLGDNAHDLYITANGVYFKMTQVGIEDGGLVWSNKNQRVPSIKWTASRDVIGGVVSALFTISTDPIA